MQRATQGTRLAFVAFAFGFALALGGVACGAPNVAPSPSAPAASVAISPLTPSSPDASVPVDGDAGAASRGARLADRLFLGESITGELAALDPREREDFANHVDALLPDAAPMMPIRPVLGALSMAWSRRAEPIVARYLVHQDHALAEHARLIVRANGLSSAAVAVAALPREPAPHARANVADASSRAPDASVASIEHLCRSIPAGSDAEWMCMAALTRLGSTTARLALAAKTRATCASAPPAEAIARLTWLAAEVGTRGPWRELGDQIRNTRATPIMLCADNFDARSDSGCKTVGHAAPIGDAFLREVVGLYALKVSFSLEGNAKTFTNAQRAEVLRLLSTPASPTP